MTDDITDDHVFITLAPKASILYNVGICKYCNFVAIKNSINEFLLASDQKCITKEEKVIKDILE